MTKILLHDKNTLHDKHKHYMTNYISYITKLLLHDKKKI